MHNDRWKYTKTKYKNVQDRAYDVQSACTSKPWGLGLGNVVTKLVRFPLIAVRKSLKFTQ